MLSLQHKFLLTGRFLLTRWAGCPLSRLIRTPLGAWCGCWGVLLAEKGQLAIFCPWHVLVFSAFPTVGVCVQCLFAPESQISPSIQPLTRHTWGASGASHAYSRWVNEVPLWPHPLWSVFFFLQCSVKYRPRPKSVIHGCVAPWALRPLIVSIY